MSVENVKKFYEAVSQDETLKQKFVELSQKYQGQQMDEAKGMSIFEQEALPLASQLGYSFSMDDLKAYGEEMKQADMNRELSDEEMEAVTGGVKGLGLCIILGVANGDYDGFCFGVGILSSSGAINNASAGCVFAGYLNANLIDK